MIKVEFYEDEKILANIAIICLRKGLSWWPYWIYANEGYP
jgi:hypothetical protein